MTCTKRFACDLCRDSIADASGGIGVKWNSATKITAIYLHDSEHHICSNCVLGLREMFADLGRMEKIRTDLALEEERECAG